MMRRLFFAAALLAVAPCYAADVRSVPDQLIIAFKEGVQVSFTKQPSGAVESGREDLDDVGRRHKLQEVQVTSSAREYLFKFEKGADLGEAMEDYERLKALVDYAQPNYTIGIGASRSQDGLKADVRRIQKRLAEGPGLKLPVFDGAARAGSHDAGPVVVGETAQPRNSVTIVGGFGRVDANGVTSGSAGAFYRRRVTPKGFDKYGNVGVQAGLASNWSGGTFRVLERDVDYGYGHDHIYETVYRVPGAKTYEFAGVDYESPRLGPVSLEVGIRPLAYSDNTNGYTEEREYIRERVISECRDSYGNYRLCENWETRNVRSAVLNVDPGSKAGGLGHAEYGAVNVKVHDKVGVRVEAGRVSAGRVSGNSLRFGGRVSW